MSGGPRPASRLIAMVATFLVIATPVVLAITTLAPLESAPRGGRTTIVEELAPDNGASVVNGEPTSDPQAGGRRNRRNRDRGQQETPEFDVATPVP